MRDILPEIERWHRDGKRMVCVFQAPDAQALRSLARANDFPPNFAVWTSTRHTP